MDGYAVRAADVATAPVHLTVVGEVAAGRPFDREIGRGEAARIFTGAVMPAGADTVVIQEVTSRDGDSVAIKRAESKGRNVRPEGLDFKAGATLLAKGHRLTARDLALAGAMNHATVPVHARPRMAVLATPSDELVPPGAPPGCLRPDRLLQRLRPRGDRPAGRRRHARPRRRAGPPRRHLSRRHALRLRGRRRRAGDDRLYERFGRRLRLRPAGLCGPRHGVLSFWKVAVRPGRPADATGGSAACRCWGCPGNPGVVLRVRGAVPGAAATPASAGRTDLSLPVERAVLGCALPENDERADYLRSTLATGDPDGAKGSDAVSQAGQLHAGAAGPRRLPRGTRAVRTGGGRRCALRDRQSPVVTPVRSVGRRSSPLRETVAAQNPRGHRKSR